MHIARTQLLPAARGLMLALTTVTTLTTGVALAQQRPEPPTSGDTTERHAMRRPPQEAYDACEDLSEDDVCEVELHDRVIEGTCVADRDDGALFCMPEHPAPPPEAAEACREKAAGDACSVTGPDGRSMPEGVCAEGRHGQEGLHCRPSKPPSNQ